jgi:hypothetical protein
MTDSRRRERGQVLPVFVVGMSAMLVMAALLFDAAHALVVRRDLQAAADASAVAGANTLLASSVLGCSSDGSTTPRTAVRDAALAALSANQGSLNLDTVQVTCAPGYGNHAVRVSLGAAGPTYFMGATPVSASATAMNGQVNALRHSMLLLNPYTPSWNKNEGCPSMLLSGGPTVNFEGSLQVNSACPASEGGALGTNGNSASVTFANDGVALLTGGYDPGPLTITPSPVTGEDPVKDPLRALPAPPTSLPVRSTSKLVLNNTSQVLEPGIYRGGIQLKNSSQAFLRPGIFYLDGGGLDVGAQASIFSVNSSISSTSLATWSSDCTTTCGVMVYNTGTKTTLDNVSIGAGATVALRPYQRAISTPDIPAYLNLLLWQSASPTPESNYSQPEIELNGGGTVDLSGTVYAPSAQVFMTGGSGGAGGDPVDVTLQFIVWDAQFQGNSSFNFYYQSEKFAKPYGYGLVE